MEEIRWVGGGDGDGDGDEPDVIERLGVGQIFKFKLQFATGTDPAP